MTGFVSIVGAGPGDPDLLTRKAERLLRKTDVVVYDRLISDAIMKLIPAGTARLFVGKSCKQHSMPQEEINATLVHLARAGKHVVRLKGGDPFTFGRGGEEAEALRTANVPYEIVPGVSAASGCTAYAGIPLTHRDYAQSVHYLTGHVKQEALNDLDWRKFADPDATLVIYMGLANFGAIAKRLQAHGLATHTPAVAIENGTLPAQRVIRATLSTLAGQLQADHVVSPCLIVVGRVAALSATLDWFIPQVMQTVDADARRVSSQ